MRNQQIDFVAGGDMLYMRIRATAQHPGCALEVWDVASTMQQEPGSPKDPTLTGMLGKHQLIELAAGALIMLKRSDLAAQLRVDLGTASQRRHSRRRRNTLVVALEE